jgi:antitoxin CcdA
MRSTRDSKAVKKPTNVSINSDLLKRARELEINLSALLERALVEYMKQHAGDQWLEENRAAIAQYNELVDANGVFSDRVRRF